MAKFPTIGYGDRAGYDRTDQSALPVAGFSLIEAADLEEAVALVARMPCAVGRRRTIATAMSAGQRRTDERDA